MKKISAKELRKLWKEFFEEKKHLYVESKSLIPNNDPSLLWINSGVATLKKYFSGEENPPSNRLVNLQKAVRTNDIENVGKTARHHTFFEMMGNFSIGDYFKKDAIDFAYEFLTKWLQIDKNLLYITVYKDDEIAYNEWIKVGIDPSHIFKEGKDRNFWDVGNGPCGPCTEIYYDRGEKYDFNHQGIKLLEDDIENDRYVEIWNIVFSEFNNDGKNNYTELKRKNIDTGAGYERVLSVLQDVPTNYDTDLFLPLINVLELHTDKARYEVNAFFTKNEEQLEINRCFKVVADHIKASVFMVADGTLPSNKERGYILRRLIRRAIICANKLDLQGSWLKDLINKIIEIMSEFYPYLKELKEKIINVISNEEEQFEKTLHTGLKIFNETVQKKTLDARTVFDLVQTYGFPKLLVDELCAQKGISYDEKEYEKLFKDHQNLSRHDDGKNIKAMATQNKNLLGLKVKSSFDYELNYIKDAKVVALFDDEFNPLSVLSGSGWVVLDKTCLYATGGGQLHDDGFINNFEVDNIIKGPNLQNLNHVESAYLTLGDVVEVRHNQLVRSLTRCNHTGVHLIQAILKKHIDPSIKQAGAFKSRNKWSYDFTYDKRLSPEEVKMVEEKVNEVIFDSIPIEVIHTNLEEAKKMNAIMEFGEMYAKQSTLRLIKMGDVSLELCGGTHAKNTSELEVIKITSYTSLGSGVWRFEGYTRYLNYYDHINDEMHNVFKQHKNTISDFLKNNKKNFDQLNNEVNDYEKLPPIHALRLIDEAFKQYSLKLSSEQNHLHSEMIKEKIISSLKNGEHLIKFENMSPQKISAQLRNLLNEIENIIVIVNILPEGYSYFIGANNSYLKSKNIELQPLVKNLNEVVKGNAGGKNNYFQGGTQKTFEESDFKTFIKDVLK